MARRELNLQYYDHGLTALPLHHSHPLHMPSIIKNMFQEHVKNAKNTFFLSEWVFYFLFEMLQDCWHKVQKWETQQPKNQFKATKRWRRLMNLQKRPYQQQRRLIKGFMKAHRCLPLSSTNHWQLSPRLNNNLFPPEAAGLQTHTACLNTQTPSHHHGLQSGQQNNLRWVKRIIHSPPLGELYGEELKLQKTWRGTPHGRGVKVRKMRVSLMNVAQESLWWWKGRRPLDSSRARPELLHADI